ncbi:MAG: phosphate ABC transporter permease [Desulfovibrio sp. MES5]|uniref:ABC transporter permease n=1 Tax=Desulfovibrio sp. MES5 TaxID=1899016 RepID=UPI000B9D296A|nr:ABC transporter permease [Desulfovibrio sp. MES5]OXS29341.1 MAG: phosphate ABC transporter permease [Desulfovibrio sp. MES5]
MAHELVIEAGHAERQYWKDLWRYRELFLILTWRDVAVQYKQTAVGILWAVLRPLLTMAAFTFVFAKVAKLPSEGVAPYPLMVFAAMLPWQLFATAIAATANSLVVNSNLVSKVYFPRIIVPAATIGVAVVDFVISLVLLALMMVAYQYVPPIQALAVLPLTLLAALVALGPGLILCALNVTYRDFRIIVPFITQFGLYLSPVGFSSSIVPEKWRLLYECNPMVGVIDGFRWAVLGSIEFPQRALYISIFCAFIFLFLGIKIFRKTERTFADVI